MVSVIQELQDFNERNIIHDFHIVHDSQKNVLDVKLEREIVVSLAVTVNIGNTVENQKGSLFHRTNELCNINNKKLLRNDSITVENQVMVSKAVDDKPNSRDEQHEFLEFEKGTVLLN